MPAPIGDTVQTGRSRRDRGPDVATVKNEWLGIVDMSDILVVDNHPIMLEFMSNLLKREGHQVKTAIDGISALEVLKTYTPEVLFIDMVMPNISGKKLCRIIRSMPKMKHAYIIIIWVRLFCNNLKK